MRFSLLVFLSLLLPVNTSLADHDHWARFRGPNGAGQGGDVNFPAQWDDDDYLWKIDLDGVGHSSPVGWGDQLFVTSGDPATGSVTLLCLDAATGAERWQRTFEGQTRRMHNDNGYAATTPAVDEQAVYMTFYGPKQVAVAAIDHGGKPRWRRDLGAFEGNHGFAASPMAVDGVVCVQVDHADEGALVGLDAATGDERWRKRRPAGKESYATPCVVPFEPEGTSPRNKVARRAVISHSTTGGMQAVDLQTGNALWQLDSVFPERCVGSPVAVGNLIIGACGSGGGGKTLVAVDAPVVASDTAKVRWELRRNLPYVPTPLVDGNRLYLWQDRGILTCVDLARGTPMWSERIGGNYYGSPVLAGEKIFCISRTGKVTVVATGSKFELLGESDLGQPSQSTPAIHSGRMYLRTESTLSCLPSIASSVDRQSGS